MSTKLTIGLDSDDVTLEFLSIAVEIVNERKKTNFKFDDLTEWDFTSMTQDIREAFYDAIGSDEIYERQTPKEGAAKMIEELLKRGHDVVFPSAVYPERMTTRALQLMRFFPSVPKDNIQLGARKDLLRLDVLLDDRDENIFSSTAKHPIIFTQPWNSHVTGCLRANNYREFIAIVDSIAGVKKKAKPCSEPKLVALVGPSGSGKTAIEKHLTTGIAKYYNMEFEKPVTHTTRQPRDGEYDSVDYYYISSEQFAKMEREGEFIESTTYSGHKYGLCKNEVAEIWNRGSHAIAPFDIAGTMALKREFGDRVLSIFVQRKKKDVVNEIISRNISNTDKANRINSLGKEYSNQSRCDTLVTNHSTIEQAAKSVASIVKKRSLLCSV
jgi:guanylate kinase